ncbi:Uncharacterized protein SVXHr_2253 [Halorhabdus sp. SVX81]|uniref:hypothetical protein n=1 Tax=Halorhabdus sp. SVX81 TaxID=2978283 RepID=UPI0023DB0265|nr:hypothetical protein [Halorhabdus sp. SVX81]WEL18407.1 Uncharacterized protein SVXHr_2253 [Halorhabdus sp. SVX81]
MPAPPDVAEIKSHIDEALHGIELEPEETAAILGFANEEVPHLQTPETSYLVLGSFRSPYIRRLRLIENELNKRIGSYAFVLGDLREIDSERLPVFRIRFYIIASYADAIAAVYEQDAGGEVTELGKISETPFFEDTYVFPRDYAWMTDRRLETKTDAFAAANRIAGNADLDDDGVQAELETVVENARSNGIAISLDEINDSIEQRDSDVASYSWVHLNEFRLFELHGRCFPWSEPADLRSAVDRIP